MIEQAYKLQQAMDLQAKALQELEEALIVRGYVSHERIEQLRKEASCDQIS